MLDKLWIVKSKDTVDRASVFWNVMSSGINSVVSMFLLLIVTRINGITDAGIFSLAFSTSQMMLTIGNYGMRNYQATDLKDKYSMRIYLFSRIVTNIIMMICVAVFIIAEEYTFEKAAVTFLLCLLKATDAFDDVYGGMYQKNGRLDISGKLMTIRIISYVIVFCVVILSTHNLVLACFFSVVTSTFSLALLVFSTKTIFKLEKPKFDYIKLLGLLRECFPLCICSFLLIYIGNAPKYAIDNYLSEAEQACYNYLFMPCFVINLFVGFALQPLLVRLSKTWIHKLYADFLRLCGIIVGGAIGISLVVIMLGRMIGCQILSVVFSVNLFPYKDVLSVLLIGGGFFAVSVIEQVMITVMRKQNFLLLGFGLASVFAFGISDFLVEKNELMGAGLTYTMSAAILCVIQAAFVLFFYKKDKRQNDDI